MIKKTTSREETSPYDLTKDIIGKEHSGRGDLSVRGEEILREMLRKKHNDLQDWAEKTS